MLVARSPPQRASPRPASVPQPEPAAQHGQASSPLKQSHTLTSEFEPLDAPSIQATPQASSTSASTVELQRQLAQALARDRHAQESLKAGEEERTKLKRELEALETEWAAARAEAEEAMERAALVDPSREVELKRRIEALEGEMRKQKIKWNANFRFTELDHRYRQLADEMREEGGTYWIEVELIRQRGKAIIAEQEAFEQACTLRRAKKRAEAATAALDQERKRKQAAANDELEEATNTIETLQNQLEEARYAFEQNEAIKIELANVQAENEALKRTQSVRSAPPARALSPVKAKPPTKTFDLDSDPDDDDDEPALVKPAKSKPATGKPAKAAAKGKAKAAISLSPSVEPGPKARAKKAPTPVEIEEEDEVVAKPVRKRKPRSSEPEEVEEVNIARTVKKRKPSKAVSSDGEEVVLAKSAKGRKASVEADDVVRPSKRKGPSHSPEPVVTAVSKHKAKPMSPSSDDDAPAPPPPKPASQPLRAWSLARSESLPPADLVPVKRSKPSLLDVKRKARAASILEDDDGPVERKKKTKLAHSVSKVPFLFGDTARPDSALAGLGAGLTPARAPSILQRRRE